MSKTINLVLYSNGEPFDSTKEKLIQTINKFSSRNVIVHDYDLNRIKKSYWYDQIKELPDLEPSAGVRDGYYCAYKPFCVHEIYENMNYGDILYYVDASRYYNTGFEESVDKLCDIVLKEGMIAGSVGKDITNNNHHPCECCNNLDIWNKILPDNDNTKLLDNMHVLASWFILTKNNNNSKFVKDYIYWCMYKDDKFTRPLITYHHTVDQSIFNILVYKYNFKVFYHENILHTANKDRNVVLKIINNSDNADKYFINL